MVPNAPSSRPWVLENAETGPRKFWEETAPNISHEGKRVKLENRREDWGRVRVRGPRGEGSHRGPWAVGQHPEREQADAKYVEKR